MMKEIFNTYIKQLQDTITSKLEAIDGKATFHQDIWERPEGGVVELGCRKRKRI